MVLQNHKDVFLSMASVGSAAIDVEEDVKSLLALWEETHFMWQGQQVEGNCRPSVLHMGFLNMEAGVLVHGGRRGIISC